MRGRSREYYILSNQQRNEVIQMEEEYYHDESFKDERREKHELKKLRTVTAVELDFHVKRYIYEMNVPQHSKYFPAPLIYS